MSSATAWQRFGEFIHRRTGGFGKRVDLHDTTQAIRARRGYCPEHGLVLSVDSAKGAPDRKPRCWCGNAVMLKSEADRIAARVAPLSMANDPTWRC